MKRRLKGVWQGKSIRLKKCKPYIMAFCVLFALVELLGSTLAWFTTADTRINSINTPPEKPFYIKAVDVFNPTKQPDGFYNKRVGAQNTEGKPGLVRLLAMAIFVIDPQTPEDPLILLPATIGAPGSGAMVIMEDFNSENWIDATDFNGGDGYFYYKHILNPGESTDTGHDTGSDRNLFNKVSVAQPLPAGYANAYLVIEVKSEAIGITTPGEYIESWWNGVIPSGASKLYEVYETLQAELGL